MKIKIERKAFNLILIKNKPQLSGAQIKKSLKFRATQNFLRNTPSLNANQKGSIRNDSRGLEQMFFCGSGQLLSGYVNAFLNRSAKLTDYSNHSREFIGDDF